jgi:hypothetical protein
MTSQATDNYQHFPDASQEERPTLMPEQETASPDLASSVSGSSLSPKVTMALIKADTDSKTEHKRDPPPTSRASLNTLKIASEVSPRHSERDEDPLPDRKSRESDLSETQPMKDSTLGMPSQPVSLPHRPVSFLTNREKCLKDQRASSLDDLLSPTATPLPQTQSFPRDSVAGSDFGEVRLDDGRFSTVSLDATATRDSTVAIKSPIDEGAAKPWVDDEPPPAPSEVSGTAVRASFLLQMLEKDSTPGKRKSLDGQHKLQAVFERAQRDSKDLEGDAANVDWGEYSSGCIY